jgi:glucuronate isomerase
MALPLAKMLNRLDAEELLPKTVIFNSNPRDNALFSTMIGSFQDGSIAGKVQHGPPWWFLDQKEGIKAQIRTLANMGVLSQFIGMTTDSRSFLSYTRHDYFRRILSNILGSDIEQGNIPEDYALVGQMLSNICYANAKRYFDFDID